MSPASSRAQQTPDRVQLGLSPVQVSSMGLGAWSWGDRFYWGFGRGAYDASDIEEAYRVSVSAGVNFIDSAEIYGLGRSEKFVGEFVARWGDRTREAPAVKVATKFFPYPWRWWRRSLRNALRASLARLGLNSVDLYQIHWPYPPRSPEFWVSALAEVHQAGLARSVGVSNFNRSQTTSAHQRLADLGVPLASNQVEFHLLNQSAETSGLLALCRELKVSVIAYSPLASGVLTGKYTPEEPPRGPRGRRYPAQALSGLRPLLNLMREIGEAHGGRTPAQVALNWLMCQGVIPIPGAKTGDQARENAGALGWSLDQVEVEALREAGQRASSILR